MPDDRKILPKVTSSTPITQERSFNLEGSPVKSKKPKTDISENPFLHELEDQESFERFRQYCVDTILPQLHDFGIEKCTIPYNDIIISPSGDLEATISEDINTSNIAISEDFNTYLQKLMNEKILRNYECDLNQDAVIICFNPKYQPHKDGAQKNKKKEWTLAIPLVNYNPKDRTIDKNVEATQMLKNEQYQETPDDKKGSFISYNTDEFIEYMYERFSSEKGKAALFPKSTHKDTPQRRNSAAHSSPPPLDGKVRILLILTLTEKEDLT